MLKSIIKLPLEFRRTFNVFSAIFLRQGRHNFCLNTNATDKSKSLPKTWLSFFAVTQAFTLFRKPESSKLATTLIAEKVIQNIITEADELYDESKYNEVYDLLYPHKDTDNVEMLWRLSRVLYNMSKQESSKEKKKDLVFEAFEVIGKALQISDTHYAVHKWYSILLDSRASYDGIKARVTQLHNVKKHMIRAVELNPKDATTLHMLGFWCFNISAMPWYQRKIASTIFASPPTSSFEEALFYFNKAEEVDPNFYSQNLLMLGKTYIELHKEEKARYYLKLASNYPARTDDDLQARKEAAELLKNLVK